MPLTHEGNYSEPCIAATSPATVAIVPQNAASFPAKGPLSINWPK